MNIDSIKNILFLISTIFGILTVATCFLMNESNYIIKGKLNVGITEVSRSLAITQVIYRVINYSLSTSIVALIWESCTGENNADGNFRFDGVILLLVFAIVIDITYFIRSRYIEKNINNYMKNYSFNISKRGKFISRYLFRLSIALDFLLSGVGIFCVLISSDDDPTLNLIIYIVYIFVIYILTICWLGEERILASLVKMEEVELCYFNNTRKEKVKIIWQDKENICFLKKTTSNNTELKLINKTCVNSISKMFLN